MPSASKSVQQAAGSAVQAARAAHLRPAEPVAPPQPDLSASLEECLAEILRLQTDEEGARPERPLTGALAERLAISRGGVVRLLRRLDQAGLIQHTPYQSVILSDEGRGRALREIRRQRLAEVFLVRIMGFGWDQAPLERRAFSSGLTQVLEERMVTLCRNPAHCPRGEPIPTAEGQIQQPEDLPLAEAPVHQACTVSRVRSDEPAKLRYLAELGLTPGARLIVLARAPFNGPTHLRVGQREHMIGPEIVRCLRVA